jgi:hypothetical protein
VSNFGITPGTPTAHMANRNISYNMLVANYGGGNGGVDNDDESLRYENNHNFQVCVVMLLLLQLLLLLLILAGGRCLSVHVGRRLAPSAQRTHAGGL